MQIKTSISLKLFIVGFLTAILMIPTGMIAVLVNDRENRQAEAFQEVSEKWGYEQTLTGPILSVPYKKIIETSVEGVTKTVEQVNYAHFLPETLNIEAMVNPEERQRGIYEVIVYTADLKVIGDFLSPDFSAWEILPENILYDKAFVSLGIPDMRGIREAVPLKWNDGEVDFAPGLDTADALGSGLSAKVDLSPDPGKKYVFSFDISLNGRRDLKFTPLGKVTEVQVTSPWSDPSFQGAFLPDRHQIAETGFTANWKVLELNRNFPQQFLGSIPGSSIKPVMTMRPMDDYEPAINLSGFHASDFGVRFFISADEYQQTVRTLKYAIMILGLTFLILFFFEAMNNKRVHPLQYILIGLALSLFYVLLLSLAEHLGFNLAYFISVLATVGLITFYSKSVFKAWRPALLESLLLIFIYVFIFVILQLEDYSLLVGALGLFVILATVMYVSRKIDWYNLNTSKK